MSSIAEFAEVTLSCPIEVNSPYDTMAPAVAQIEAVVAQIFAATGERTRRRIEKLEQIRHESNVTLNEARAHKNQSNGASRQKLQ
ncbi:MAG: hypothetical protein E5X61_10780 [Mesorhizobium sp.]|nr:MAG: hypothetical protein E5X61_10780 [Mesorhizobium sp.]